MHKVENFDVIEGTTKKIHDARREGIITFEEIVQAHLDRISAYNNILNAVINTNKNAVDRAAELDEVWENDGPISPVHGIPVLAKDNINTSNIPTTSGSVLFNNTVPPDDAHIISRLRRHGAIIIAKANLGELSSGSLSSSGGQTRNPHCLSRDTGGSSSGTGSGIAANFAVLGIGTDTGGSVRHPSGFCSLVGLRPTTGLFSRDGIQPISDTQDTAGPMTRTVTDAAKMADVMSGYDPNDPWTAKIRSNAPDSYTDYLNKDGLAGKRLGVVRQFFGPKTQEGESPEKEAQAVTNLINKRIEDIEDIGAEIIDPIEIPNIETILEEAGVSAFEFNREFNAYLNELGDTAPVDSPQEILESGTVEGYVRLEEYIEEGDIPPEENKEYLQAFKLRKELQEIVLGVLESNNLDALVYPMASRITSHIEEDRLYRTSSNAKTAAYAGLPALTVPAGYDDVWETPVGIEFLSGMYEEPKLFEMGYAFEQSTKCRKKPNNICKV